MGLVDLTRRPTGLKSRRSFSYLVLQVFQWVEARLSRTQRSGTRTRTRKRLNRFKSIAFSGKLEPQSLGRMSTTSQYSLRVRVRKEPVE
jgi:hypothetical protein